MIGGTLFSVDQGVKYVLIKYSEDLEALKDWLSVLNQVGLSTGKNYTETL